MRGAGAKANIEWTQGINCDEIEQERGEGREEQCLYSGLDYHRG